MADVMTVLERLADTPPRELVRTGADGKRVLHSVFLQARDCCEALGIKQAVQATNVVCCSACNRCKLITLSLLTSGASATVGCLANCASCTNGTCTAQCRAAGLTGAAASDDVARLHALFDVALGHGLGSLVVDYVIEVCSDRFSTSRSAFQQITLCLCSLLSTASCEDAGDGGVHVMHACLCPLPSSR